MKNAITNKRIFSLIMAVIMLFCVLPFNSVSFEADDIRILHDGKAVSEIKLPSNEKTIISVSDKDADSYQWQIFMPASSQWIDIYDKTSVSCEISYTLLESFIDSSNKSQLRCEIEKNGKINQSSTLTVEITDAAAKDAKPLKINKPMLLADNANNTPGEGAFKTHTVTIKYLYYNESPDMVGSVANDYIATIAAITDFDAEVSSPVRTGYKAYLATEENWSSTDNRWFFGADEATLTKGENVKIDIKNISRDYIFYVVYLPQPAKYHISTYFQNKYDDFYSFGKSIIKEAPVGSVISNSTELNLNTEGFTMLEYDSVTVAADDSTVIEIFFDRKYHLMNFQLEGGHGVEPVYARYGTDFKISKPSKAGYIFEGWEIVNDNNQLNNEQVIKAGEIAESLKGGEAVSIPDFDITFKAKWAKAEATYNVVYWKENANDTGYSYWGTVTQTAQSGDTITFDPDNPVFNTAYLDFSSDVVQEAVNATSTGYQGEVYSAIPARYEYEFFTYDPDSSDNSKVVMGDSSTVLNVYYKRNTYDLKYYYARSSVNDNNQYCKNIMPNSDGILPNGDYVVWFKGATINDKVVTNNTSGNQLRLSGNVNVPNAYTLKFEHISDSSYYVTDENGRYLFIGGGSAEFRETATNITVTYNSDGDFWLLKCDRQYLNQYGGSGANVAAGYDTIDSGCQLLISQPLDNPVISKYQVCSSTRQPIMQNMTWSYNTFTFPEFSDDRYTYGYDIIDGYMYHYLTLNNVKYNQIITHLWPVNVLPQVMHYLTPEWAPFDGCKYRTDNKANATLKVYSTLSAEIINDPGDSESSKFVAWWGDKNHSNENFQIQNFHIYYSALPDEEAEVTNGGIGYIKQPDISYIMSYNNSTQITPIDLYGVTVEKEKCTYTPVPPKDGFEAHQNSTFYYTRNPHILEFYNIDDKIHTDNLVYGQKIESFNTFTAEVMERDYYPSQYEQGAYTFKGWSLSPSAYVPVDWENFCMDDADLSVYAYWEKTTHNVKFYETYNDMKNGKAIPDGENADNDVNVPHGEPVNYPSTISRDGYSFVGWFYLNENTNEKIAFLPNNMPVNKDLKIYAEWVADKMIRYTIHYVGADAQKDNNGEYLLSNGKYVLDMETCKPIADDTVGQLQDGRTKTFSAKALPELWDGYNTGYFPELASHAIMFSEDTNDTDHDVTVTKVNMDGTPYDGEGEYTYTIEYTFYYVHLDEVQYTVNYINTATGNNIFESAENDTDTFEVASKSQFTDEAVTTERFKMIQKYVPDEYQKRIVLTAYPDRNIINFYYTKNQSPMFLVEHLTENLDGTWTVQVREFSTGNTGETISRHTFDYAGHVFKPKADWVNTQGQELEPTDGDKWVTTYIQGDNTYSAAGELESGKILVIRFYYVLTSHNYTIEHKILGGGWLFGTEENSSETGTKKYGDRFEGRAKQEEALAKGYYVDGSKTDPSRLYQSKIITDGDNVITFYYVSEPIEINYRIIVNGVVGTNISGCYVTPTLNSTSSHDSSVNGSTPHIAPGYYFDGWYADEQCSKKVSPDWIGADNKITPKPENGILSQATYYAKVEPCSLTITKKGDVKANETFLFNVASTDGKFDKVVSITGNNSTTIDYIPQGEYTITEISDWSWKYNAIEAKSITITTDHTVEFENSRNENKLLGDESNINNVFAAVS
ncbi:MAG: InlB B-repeat-containing protein [Ruminococcus sp.]|nr:InlB B-repeat-containing protein [Ruminococcus sp.]